MNGTPTDAKEKLVAGGCRCDWHMLPTLDSWERISRLPCPLMHSDDPYVELGEYARAYHVPPGREFSMPFEADQLRAYQNDPVISAMLDREVSDGNFSTVSRIAQSFKSHIAAEVVEGEFSAEQIEAFGAISTGLARILCGDPDNKAHWIEIAVSASQVARWLEFKR